MTAAPDPRTPDAARGEHEHEWVRTGSGYGHIFYACSCGATTEDCDCP
jgi:hypothetical protein